ncbi:DddA-like double-stranded DNA deaminase toxin [Actinokineospora sp. G85]|uniref:DddA-like double-stranded DNA deaminase toxin n=1 Tax=Actinokineospora sp. G85 TaxID=3406626 RepID=UPI003C77E0C0
MTDLRAVVAALERCRGGMATASALTTDGGRILATLADAESGSALSRVVGDFDHGLDGLARADHGVAQVVEMLTAYIGRLIGDTGGSGEIRKPEVGGTPQPGFLWGADWVETVRRELPPDVRPGSGEKTHSRWDAGDGEVKSSVSGEDEVAALVRSYLGKMTSRPLAIETHVEMKVAAHLRQRYEATGVPQHGFILINHQPCRGGRSCSFYLPRMLPPGCSLTVHGTGGYCRTFTGGSR